MGIENERNNPVNSEIHSPSRKHFLEILNLRPAVGDRKLNLLRKPPGTERIILKKALAVRYGRGNHF